MSSFDSLDAFLLAASRACCSPLAIFIQIQGFFICLALALGWALAAYVRLREIRQMKYSSEGTGLRPLVERSCTQLIRILGNHSVDVIARGEVEEDTVQNPDLEVGPFWQ
ncbi:unnamed protein product [Fraxinus pennsylvanica]|uniref:Uncharacterized protein n=1 Tax=Fraxinus pennsylvanica TaxID=56036 RepID=A0AAD1YY14_9LAMI|nr:unnamed protein product [Fraxinus pennsylvanica]